MSRASKGFPDFHRPWTRHYADGVPQDLKLPKGSLVDMVEESVSRYGSKPALQFFGATTSYRDMGEQIRRAAAGLKRLGVGPGDRVALVLPNAPQHVVAFYAVLRLGAVVVEHNPLYTDRELRHQFEDHGATVAIVWDKVADRIQSLPADIPVRTIVSVDLISAMPRTTRLLLKLPLPAARRSRSALAPDKKPRSAGRRVLEWKELLDNRPLPRRSPHPRAEDLAAIQYTSGTTAAPKGAMLTHANLMANAAQGRAWIPGIRMGKETVYGVLPMFHAYGLTLSLTFAMSIGAKLVLFPKFDVDMVLKAAKKTPPTFLPAVPPIYDRIVAGAQEQGISLKGVRFAISGAMNLPAATVDAWEKATGGYLIEGYGLTETSPVALGNPMGPTRKAGTVGVPFPLTDIKVVDPEDPTKERHRGEAGELLIRGPQVFQGYWNKPAETRAALLDGGWFRTGDIVSVDDDDFVTIRDRIKELIITGGFNVSPSEVEEALKRHPAVAEAAVVGLTRTGGGEDVVAAVVARPNAEFDADELRSFVRAELAAYKVPRRIVQIPDLPRSLIGKVLRRHVKESLQPKGTGHEAGPTT
ncbi:long-chain-fatty-acid--CoA ligase [Arthrobacter koreensis]|uniref:Long-chain-fatty-acid--CoA ligase n=1 Tax=Arthrobacter koreensis TaxID=199136 RepID=A0ABY6FVC7_9MICC|nr:long-chain-fatty-acid--CoA ligase [Arthrobacter koreensis]MDF2498023.1 long-chain fatty acid--CoA ligase [Arthrobacter koreensis]UYB36686.1 long-chain-fatty-acid--CoA ligase [Arthrobacter koreensis]